jgi:hypothetical protein
MPTLLILLLALAVVTALSLRFLAVRKKEAEGAAMAPQAVLMSKLAAVTFGVIGLGLVALMIYVFYFEP